MRHRQVLLFAVIALGTTVSGCRRGNDLDLQAVSGSVTLDSRLLDSGTMRFVPMAKNGLLGAPRSPPANTAFRKKRACRPESTPCKSPQPNLALAEAPPNLVRPGLAILAP